MPFGIFKVTGESMLPGLRCGDYVFARKRPKQLLAGDLVVVDHDRFGVIVKRIKAALGNNQYTLIGDNPSVSTSSEAIGVIGRNHVVGKVIFRIKRPQ